MSDINPTPAAAATNDAAGVPNKIDSTVLGFLAGLAIKGAVDTLCKNIPSCENMHQVVRAIGGVELTAFIVFFITIIRFLYGAYRFQEEAVFPTHTEVEPWVQIWNVVGALSLFMMFYVTGLTIRHPYPFFVAIIGIHVTDFIWFVQSVRTKALPKRLLGIMHRFLWIDIWTIVTLSAFVFTAKTWLISPTHAGHDRVRLGWFVAVGTIIMASFTMYDVVHNRVFFFDPERWRKQNPLDSSPVQSTNPG